MNGQEEISLEMREKVWDMIYNIIIVVPDLNQRAIIVQKYISEGGPVPDSRGNKIRQALKEL